MNNPFSLKGMTVLITGASSGIGQSVAIECSKMGAKVILSARNLSRLNETLSYMAGCGHDIISADLSSDEGISSIVQKVPKLNGVVNIAGIECDKPIKFITRSNLESVFSVNTFSCILLVQQLLKSDKISDGASLVFISSIASKPFQSIGNGIYSASKIAIESFSRQCVIELSNKRIRSNVLLPGLIDTPMLENTAFCINKFHPNANLNIGKAVDVALPIVFLLSRASSFINGASIVIDGGFSLHKLL